MRLKHLLVLWLVFTGGACGVCRAEDSCGALESPFWPETEMLDEWFCETTGSDLGKTHGGPPPVGVWTGGFGWFIYRVLLDPGPMLPVGSKLPVAGFVTPDVHREYAAIAQECRDSAVLGQALLSLFPEADYLGRLRGDLGWWQDWPSELSKLQRARLKIAVLPLGRLQSEQQASRRATAIAALLAALVSGDAQVDSVSVGLLSTIADRYPDQTYTAFVSRFYLVTAMQYRRDKGEAVRIARQAVTDYGNDKGICTLKAYAHLKEVVRIADSTRASESRAVNRR